MVTFCVGSVKKVISENPFNTEITEAPIAALSQRATKEVAYPLNDAVKIPAAWD